MKMNTSRMIELALVFFVSLLSFSIGTFVGKKYSDNQHRLSQLEPKSENATAESSHDKEGSSVIEGDKHTAAAAHGAAITDSDVAKLAEEFAAEEEPTTETAGHKTAPIAKTAVATEAAHETASPPPAKTQASAKTKDVKEVSDDEEEQPAQVTREVASISPTKSLNQYTVQVGAYPSPTEAEKMTSSLKARGYKASYVTATVNGKQWYRVQVGTFANLVDAQNHKKELMEQNHLTSAIIQKIQK